MLKNCFCLLLASPLLVAAPSLAASLAAHHWTHDGASAKSASLLLGPRSADPRSAIAGERVARGLVVETTREDALVLGARMSSLVHPDAGQIAAWKAIYGSSSPRERAERGRGADVRFVLDSDVGYDGPDRKPPGDRDVVPAVPEPVSAAAFGLGVLMVAAVRVRRAQRTQPVDSPVVGPRS